MPAFLSYLNCITNHLLKNLLNLFRHLSSRSPPPNFPPFRHRAVSSSFSAEPPVPFPFPLAPPSRHIIIVSLSAACACPATIIDAARVSPLFFSHILFNPFYFSLLNFSQTLFFLRWLPLSFSTLCCLLPARAVPRSLRARAGQRTTRRCPHCWLCTRITPPASRHGRHSHCYSLCRCVPAARARQASVRPAAAPARFRPVPSPSQLAPCYRASRPTLMARLLYCP
jgi:hypothetical protein